MANKKYTEFTAAAYDKTRLILQGDPTTGALFKTTILAFAASMQLPFDIAYSMGQHGWDFNNMGYCAWSFNDGFTTSEVSMTPYQFYNNINPPTGQKSSFIFNSHDFAEPMIGLGINDADNSDANALYIKASDTFFMINLKRVGLPRPTVHSTLVVSVNSMAPGTDGNVIIGQTEYADNAAAIAAGKAVGYIYRTGDLLKVVHA